MRYKLPTTFRSLVDQHYRPLVERIVKWKADKPNAPLILGVNGAQGTGKSTLGMILIEILKHDHNLKAFRLSIDDIYYRRSERQKLAEEVHPLLRTRGAPGTHDISLANEILDSWINANASSEMRTPRFDKTVDDRAPEATWPTRQGRPDIIIFEGWLVGTPPQDEEALATPVNILESSEDPDGTWRKYTNEQLAGPYAELFAKIDRIVMLCAPSMEAVLHWRQEQEWRLARERDPSNAAKLEMLNGEAMTRFVRHYERLTLHAIDTLPAKADAVIWWNEHHTIDRSEYK